MEGMENEFECLKFVYSQYLRTEESPLKYNLFEKFNALAEKWLCSRPSYEKFIIPDFSDIFDGIFNYYGNMTYVDDVSKCFTAFARYADNLYLQPWRKEFQIIEMQSGFYHELIYLLKQSEKILWYIGYEKAFDQSIAGFVLVRKHNVDPIQIFNVSLGCTLIALECKLMSKIFKKVRESEIRISILDVYHFRMSHTCTWYTAADALIDQFRMRRLESGDSRFYSNINDFRDDSRFNYPVEKEIDLDCNLEKEMEKLELAEKNWSCRTCTLKNSSNFAICQGCFKSKDQEDNKNGNEKSCPQCTFLNTEKKIFCDTCGSFLL